MSKKRELLYPSVVFRDKDQLSQVLGEFPFFLEFSESMGISMESLKAQEVKVRVVSGKATECLPQNLIWFEFDPTWVKYGELESKANVPNSYCRKCGEGKAPSHMKRGQFVPSRNKDHMLFALDPSFNKELFIWKPEDKLFDDLVKEVGGYRARFAIRKLQVLCSYKFQKWDEIEIEDALMMFEENPKFWDEDGALKPISGLDIKILPFLEDLNENQERNYDHTPQFLLFTKAQKGMTGEISIEPTLYFFPIFSKNARLIEDIVNRLRSNKVVPQKGTSDGLFECHANEVASKKWKEEILPKSQYLVVRDPKDFYPEVTDWVSI